MHDEAQDSSEVLHQEPGLVLEPRDDLDWGRLKQGGASDSEIEALQEQWEAVDRSGDRARGAFMLGWGAGYWELGTRTIRPLRSKTTLNSAASYLTVLASWAGKEGRDVDNLTLDDILDFRDYRTSHDPDDYFAHNEPSSWNQGLKYLVRFINVCIKADPLLSGMTHEPWDAKSDITLTEGASPIST